MVQLHSHIEETSFHTHWKCKKPGKATVSCYTEYAFQSTQTLAVRASIPTKRRRRRRNAPLPAGIDRAATFFVESCFLVFRCALATFARTAAEYTIPRAVYSIPVRCSNRRIPATPSPRPDTCLTTGLTAIEQTFTRAQGVPVSARIRYPPNSANRPAIGPRSWILTASLLHPTLRVPISGRWPCPVPA